MSRQTIQGIYDTEASVVSHRPSGSIAHIITFRCEEIARAARPVQFFTVSTRPVSRDGGVDNPSLDPILRRPFGFSSVRPEQCEFDAIYQVVGRGTKLISELRPGDKVRILGPLGTPINARDFSAKTVILVGGGQGLPPLYHLAPLLSKAGLEVVVIAGARAKDMLIMETAPCPLNRPIGDIKETIGLKPFVDSGIDCVVTLDDSAAGFLSGLATDPLEKYLEDRFDGGVEIICCGPMPMLRAIAKMTEEKKVRCRLIMESRMGCALGACQACVCKTTGGYKRVCTEGPVFNAEEIVWD